MDKAPEGVRFTTPLSTLTLEPNAKHPVAPSSAPQGAHAASANGTNPAPTQQRAAPIERGLVMTPTDIDTWPGPVQPAHHSTPSTHHTHPVTNTANAMAPSAAAHQLPNLPLEVSDSKPNAATGVPVVPAKTGTTPSVTPRNTAQPVVAAQQQRLPMQGLPALIQQLPALPPTAVNAPAPLAAPGPLGVAHPTKAVVTAENGTTKAPSGNNDTSSSLHPTSSDSLEKVAMRERIVIGEEATGGAEEDEEAPGGSNAEEDGDDSGDALGDAAAKDMAAKLAGDFSSGPSSEQGIAMATTSNGGERVPTGVLKTCSLCGSTKDTAEFGPKKGSRDGKDCYCRICSTLRRRYSIPVVRAAVENGTLHQLLGPGKPRSTFPSPSPAELRTPPRPPQPGGQTNPMPPLGNTPPPNSTAAGIPLATALAGAAGATAIAATGALALAHGGGAGAEIKLAPCVLCAAMKPKEDIAMFVAGDAFCVPCDRLRRRANNLGLGTKDVIDANRSGSLAGFLGLSAQQLAQEMGRSAPVPLDTSAPAKAPTGRICRMCRQVRAPVVDGQRLSYCTDCEVVKGRAQARGFTVSQLQDAFEANTFRALFGDMYNYIAAGTRFDYSRSAGAAPAPPGADDIVPGMGPTAGPDVVAAGENSAAAQPAHASDDVMEGDDDTSPSRHQPTRQRKRKFVDVAELGGGEEAAEEDTEWGAVPVPAAVLQVVQSGGLKVEGGGGAAAHQLAGNFVGNNGINSCVRVTEGSMFGGPKQELLRRCALCRAIRPLSEFPLDGKRSHGRACYCHPCKRLRGRAQSVSKTYDTAWLRASLEANALRERLGISADSVLSIIQPDKPVTTCLSPDAQVDWAGDNPMVWRAAAVRASQAAAAAAGGGAAAAADGGPGLAGAAAHVITHAAAHAHAPGGILQPHNLSINREANSMHAQDQPTGPTTTVPGGGAPAGSTLPGLGTNPPPGPPLMQAHIGLMPTHAATVTSGACAQVAGGGVAVKPGSAGVVQGAPYVNDLGQGEPQGYGEQEGVSVAVGALTRTVLNEVREYTKMCLAVRERMLMPGLTEWQLEVERQTGAELETHLIDLRALVARAFLGSV